MADIDDFWAPRPCLFAPPPEQELAADLLSQAANALLVGNLAPARDLVRRADMPVLCDHAFGVMYQMNPQVQRKRPVAIPPVKSHKIAGRMPADDQIRKIFARDGWRCRFCDCRVVSRKVRPAMSAALPGAIPWSKTKTGYSHAAFYAMTASIDHVVPHCAGARTKRRTS